jgi:hypothetical protein
MLQKPLGKEVIQNKLQQGEITSDNNMGRKVIRKQ